MTHALTTIGKNEIIEQVLISGNLQPLTPAQRVEYYNAVCDSVGLNPLTKPFDYITLNNKLTLYARKDATDQLRKRDGVSIYKIEKELAEDGTYTVTAYAKTADGREDVEDGCVSLAGLKGELLANAKMKALTKAKRRVTLSICGLGWLDETEVDSIPGAVKQSQMVETANGSVNTHTGEIAPPEQSQAVQQSPAPAASTVTPEQIAAGIEALRRDWPSEDTEETCRWAEGNLSNPEVLILLRSKWREFFVEFVEELQSAEPEVYPVPNAVNSARRKYLGEDKIADGSWKAQDLAKLREYRAHINEKLDAATEKVSA